MELNLDALPKETYEKYADILHKIESYFARLEMDCKVLDNPEEVFVPVFSALIAIKEESYFANMMIVPFQEEMLEENMLFQFVTDFNIEVAKDDKERYRTAVEEACRSTMMGNVSFIESTVTTEHIQFKYAYPAPNVLTLPNNAIGEMFAFFIAASLVFIDIFYDLAEGNITPEEACQKLGNNEINF